MACEHDDCLTCPYPDCISSKGPKSAKKVKKKPGRKKMDPEVVHQNRLTYQRKYYADRKEKYQEYMRNYYQTHKEEYRLREQKYKRRKKETQ